MKIDLLKIMCVVYAAPTTVDSSTGAHKFVTCSKHHRQINQIDYEY
jgi:hypothetical protein